MISSLSFDLMSHSHPQAPAKDQSPGPNPTAASPERNKNNNNNTSAFTSADGSIFAGFAQNSDANSITNGHTLKRKLPNGEVTCDIRDISSQEHPQDESAPILTNAEGELVASRPGSNKSSTESASSITRPILPSASLASSVESMQNFIEAQRAFQKLTSQLSGFDQRNPFNLGTLSPFIAALQQQTLHQQLFNANALSTAGMRSRCDAEKEGSTASKPEDLSICSGRDRKLELDESGCATAASNWSYEEQFKQLYELSDDPKRKEWLDDWLSFMHRIGKPVTRIPIMAKQVLDLYELYRLVVQHGGLVEIINKKLWREITKGLNLPNSITSAAFTLRTQYQKYLYDYECHHENLSCLSDLQAAIEGNRREGRSRHHQSHSHHTTSTPSSNVHNSMNGSITANNIHTSVNDVNASLAGTAVSTAAGFSYPLMAPHSVAAALFGKHFNALGLKTEDELNTLNHFNAQQSMNVSANLEAAQQTFGQRQLEFLQKAAIEAVSGNRHSNIKVDPLSGRNSQSPNNYENFSPSIKRAKMDSSTHSALDSSAAVNFSSVEQLFKDSPSAHMKLTNTRTPNGENSMVVSMEINGTMYQGVLFAIGSSPTNSSPPVLAIGQQSASSGIDIPGVHQTASQDA
ncbi:ARID/BRIGHT DNA binding domain-containing protein [Ditylenchus destructor]|nr:ARID/BRIGHT DNA binding domain-containing protein [Ditylenchus destructor]